MFELYEHNNLPCVRSPLAITRKELQLIFDRAIQSGRMVTFTLEDLSWTSEWTAKITPRFEIKFGHFGLKITGVTRDDQRTVNYTWPINGRLIDLEGLYDDLFQPSNMWLLNDLSYQSIGQYRYRALPTHDEPVVSSGSTEWISTLTIRHRYGFEETVPYIRAGNHHSGHLLGRWYRTENNTDWKLEWVEVPDERLSVYSRMEVSKNFLSAVYPLMDENPLVSDFLCSTELYIPPNFVPMMTDQQTIKQLRDALWWMECRFRVVPRFPKWMLDRLMNQIILEKERFHLPMFDEPMNTTKILQTYSNRGNSILRWLLTRPLQTMEDS